MRDQRGCMGHEGAHKPMWGDPEVCGIEPNVLGKLAEKALHGEKIARNPYLKALMARFRRVALELKAALESEGRLEAGQTDASDKERES